MRHFRKEERGLSLINIYKVRFCTPRDGARLSRFVPHTCFNHDVDLKVRRNRIQYSKKFGNILNVTIAT